MKRAPGGMVPTVLRCLFDEHRHMGALTNLLAEKVSKPGSMRRSDYYLLRDVVGYLHDYPDQVHHPTENLLFDRVVRREPELAVAADRLRVEHDAIAAETQRILDLLDRLIEEPDAAIERDVRAACRAFADRQQAHMQFENDELFPLALGSLSRSDWMAIESHLAAAEDPLFGRIVAGRHRLLYEYLLGPADRAESGLAGVQLAGMERMLLTSEILEQGIEAWCGRLRDLGDEALLEWRSMLRRTARPAGVGLAVTLPARYSLNLAKSLFACGSDLGRIWVGTVVDALKALGPTAGGDERHGRA